MGLGTNRQLHDLDIRRTYEEELLVGEATETLSALVSGRVTQRELARRLGVTEGRVSQILSGAENLTLRSLGAFAWALGLRFRLQPVAMADRRGTPALADGPMPSWLEQVGAISPSDFIRLEPARRANLDVEPAFIVEDKPGESTNEKALAA